MFEAVPRTAEEKFGFMQLWYRWFHSNTKKWNGELGSELTYLFGAIMNDTFILVSGKSEIVSLLRRKKIKNDSAIWKYLHFFDN